MEIEPIKATTNGFGVIYIEYGGRGRILQFGAPGGKKFEPLAKEIASRCNSHAALLEACKAALYQLQQFGELHRISDTTKQLAAAIKTATP